MVWRGEWASLFFFSFLSRIHPGCKRDVLFTWKGLQQQQRAEMGGSGLELQQGFKVSLRKVGVGLTF